MKQSQLQKKLDSIAKDIENRGIVPKAAALACLDDFYTSMTTNKTTKNVDVNNSGKKLEYKRDNFKVQFGPYYNNSMSSIQIWDSSLVFLATDNIPDDKYYPRVDNSGYVSWYISKFISDNKWMTKLNKYFLEEIKKCPIPEVKERLENIAFPDKEMDEEINAHTLKNLGKRFPGRF